MNEPRGVPTPDDALFPVVNEPRRVPAADDALFPELLGPPGPPPPARPRGSTVLRTLGRVVLWSLVAVGAFRGLVPPTAASPDRPTPVDVAGDRTAEAVATAFLREYLTVGVDRAGRAERLRQFTAAGVDLRRSVSVPDGVTQYVDQVVASGVRGVETGTEVTVIAHVLQLRLGTYRDGGTLAFVVPMAVGREGIAVGGTPRPITLPVAAGRPLGPPMSTPAELVRPAEDAARRAVVALVHTDLDALARLGGDRPPSTRALPPGWRVVGVGGAEVTGQPPAFTARVAVRARPPVGDASYLIPVRVHLESNRRGVLVRQVDAGGPA